MLAAGMLLLASAGCGLLSGGDLSWPEAAARIDGIVDYRVERPDLVISEHTEDPVSYQVMPPVAGPHHPSWQDCNGVVYPEPIRDVHAVHSLEHGAVWVAYHPDLPEEQVAALAERVRETEKLFMSPYPDLDAPISLQAWGYQLKLADAGDDRIDEFIRVLRVNASPEGPTAPCTGGVGAVR
jgi:hypothetical protein